MILGVKPRYGLKKSKPRASGDDPNMRATVQAVQG